MKTVIKSVLRSTSHTAPVVAATAILLVGGGVGGSIVYAAASSKASSVIHACKKKTTGALRVIAAGKSCATGETALQWNTAGPGGPAGPAGPTSGIAIEAPAYTDLGSNSSATYKLNLPSGKYILNGMVMVAPPTGAPSMAKDTEVRCTFVDGLAAGFWGAAYLSVGQVVGTSSITGYSTSGTNAGVHCSVFSGGPVRVRASVTAIPVTNLATSTN
ncbi:MAG: hypothetical protein QOE54_4847 [Streptosporangiaceae bacterium]|jgi:hypothetical protein|nr:hypothetical protein [Streptosporangiaceae bacterium]